MDNESPGSPQSRGFSLIYARLAARFPQRLSSLILHTDRYCTAVDNSKWTTEKNNMAADVYLQIDGVNGESNDDKHKGWIEVVAVD